MGKVIFFIFGTRPEAIKMAPLIKSFKEDGTYNVQVCITGQHRQMLDQVLHFFDITPDYDLNIMQEGQDLYDITNNILIKLRSIFKKITPDFVFVHGDTTTSFVTSLACFYQKIPVGHVEAGLRTYNILSPWPEEANRQLVRVIAKYHFAPTKNAEKNLLSEHIEKSNIIVTGNTVIDALLLTIKKINSDDELKKRIITYLSGFYSLSVSRKFILVTGHRRENFGEGFINICEALKEIAIRNCEIDIVYPVHLNPNVQKPVKEILSGIDNIYLIPPLEYENFVYLMNNCYFVVTDSGGIQEEAPALGKPVLVMRDTTERPEGVDVGTVRLVGVKKDNIVLNIQQLLNDSEAFQKMAHAKNPYGIGNSSELILNYLKRVL